MTERSNGASSNGVHEARPHYPPLAQQPPADPNPPYRLPLAGVRILDMSVFQQGTYASAMLADMGADVVKIEGPDSPDPGRGSGIGLAPNDLSPYFQHLNRNKRAICLDLKHERGRETFLKLVETADIFHNNMRPGVLDRLGLTYEVLKERNPRIIVSNATGWGNEGPDAEAQMGSMDILARARGGIMSVTGTPDTGPLPVGAPFADHTGAIISAFGMMTALWEREHSGEGQVIDTSLYGSQLCIQGLNITSAMWGRPAPRPGRRRGPTAALDALPLPGRPVPPRWRRPARQVVDGVLRGDGRARAGRGRRAGSHEERREPRPPRPLAGDLPDEAARRLAVDPAAAVLRAGDL